MNAALRRAIGATLAICGCLLAITAATTLWDRDEPRFAQAAVEMLASGNYLVPTFNGQLRGQKPPLVYWLMTLSLRLFGPSEFAVRFWSPIGIAIAAFATFIVGRRFWSARVGLVAMAILVLTPMTFVQGVAATTDALLLASITDSVMILSDPTRTTITRITQVILWAVVCGIGLLIKGPVAVVLPLGIAIASLALARREGSSRYAIAAVLVVASALAIAIYAAWLVPAADATGGEMWRRTLWYENVERFVRPMEGHGTPLLLAPFYYAVVIAIAFAPWTRHLGAALRQLALTQGLRSEGNALLVAWIGVPLIAFTLSATKLPHYILPVWPALALVVAINLCREGDAARGPAAFRRSAVAGGVILVCMLIGGVVLDRLKPVPLVAAQINRVHAGGPIFTYAFEEPSLVFYARGPVVTLDSGDAVASWARTRQDGILVTTRSALQGVEYAHGPLPVRELVSARGWNYANGRQLELVALVRQVDR